MIVIADCKSWNETLKAGLKKRILPITDMVYINCKEELNMDYLKQLDPKYIFFPYWSSIIPEEIFSRFKCIIFHMTDLPFGRGGSPLQNLLARGIYETKLTALQCVKELDAGPIYLKRALSLHGNAQEIYWRASALIEEMIVEIMQGEIKPIPQEGEVVLFKRRSPADSNMIKLTKLIQVYDYIRMLDADGYPKAFLDIGEFRLEFSRALFREDEIIADVKIRKHK